MILDGYWKRDLYQIRTGLIFWSRMGFGGFAEHQISRGLLYSAAIIRKIAEPYSIHGGQGCFCR